MKHLSKIVFLIISVLAFGFITFKGVQTEETRIQAEESIGQASTVTDATVDDTPDDSADVMVDDTLGDIADAAPGSTPDYISDSFHEVYFSNLYTEGSLIFDGFSPEVSTKDDMLSVSACRGDLNSGKIIIGKTFDFGSSELYRLTTYITSEEEAEGEIYIYLDDDSVPLCTMGFSEYNKGHDKHPEKFSVSLIGKNLHGEHSVSIGLNITSGSDEDTFHIYFRSIEFALFTVPVVRFNIDESQGTIAEMNGSKDHSTCCYGTVDIMLPNGYISEYTGNPEASTTGLELEYVRGRGHSTWWVSKKPYKFKLKKGKNLLGMGSNKHWVLIANFYDNSQMRNRMTYRLGAYIGMEFTPQCIPVEVMMNDHYYGTYLLAEQIRVGKSRVDIDELKDDEHDEPIITGGYLLSMSPYSSDPHESKFTTHRGVRFLNESPDFYEDGNDEQKTYIRNYIQSTENAIFGEEFKDEAGNSYKDYMDFNSLVDYWWIQELAANKDAYITSSTYLYKKRNGLLYWGPLWDFDYVAWGDLQYTEDKVSGFNNTKNLWSTRLKDDPEFTDALIQRWPDIDAALEEIVKQGGLLDRYREEVRVSESYNYEQWGRYNSPCRTYDAEVEDLRYWIIGRRKWINANLNQLHRLKYTVTYIVDGEIYAEEQCLTGIPITKLKEAPKKEGKVFYGWCTEDGQIYIPDTEKDPAKAYDEDITLYAEYRDRKVDPDDPDSPDDPVTPDDPDSPDDPVTPDDPDTPDDPVTPDNPDTPDDPVTPDNPDNPDKPVSPDTPSRPSADEKAVPKKTADDTPIGALVVLLIISVAYFGFYVYRKKCYNQIS